MAARDPEPARVVQNAELALTERNLGRAPAVLRGSRAGSIGTASPASTVFASAHGA
jgi:hypothetical protein